MEEINDDEEEDRVSSLEVYTVTGLPIAEEAEAVPLAIIGGLVLNVPQLVASTEDVGMEGSDWDGFIVFCVGTWE